MNISRKTRLSTVMARTGLLNLSQRLLGPDGRLAFTLHRVLPDQEVATCHNPYLVLTERSFERFIPWLLRNFSIVSLAQLLETPTGGPGAKRLCSLTFDD